MATNILTDSVIKSAKPAAKLVKLFDGGGLQVLIKPTGAKYWRMKYRHAGVEKTLAFGVYPEVSLKRAREKREEAGWIDVSFAHELNSTDVRECNHRCASAHGVFR